MAVLLEIGRQKSRAFEPAARRVGPMPRLPLYSAYIVGALRRPTARLFNARYIAPAMVHCNIDIAMQHKKIRCDNVGQLGAEPRSLGNLIDL
jgi:hypothetical protein